MRIVGQENPNLFFRIRFSTSFNLQLYIVDLVSSELFVILGHEIPCCAFGHEAFILFDHIGMSLPFSIS